VDLQGDKGTSREASLEGDTSKEGASLERDLGASREASWYRGLGSSREQYWYSGLASAETDSGGRLGKSSQSGLIDSMAPETEKQKKC
jgi:hypothetical protein